MAPGLNKWSLHLGSLLAILYLGESPICAQPLCPAPSSLPPACPGLPSYPYPATPTTPPGMVGQPPSTGAPGVEGAPTSIAEPALPSLGAGQAFAAEAATFAAPGGYIDNAIPKTMFRLRFDAAYDDNRPDRAEFFYAKCGCFIGTPGFFGRAPGPPAPNETSVDYQDISSYLEVALNNRFSGFVEVPVRFLNPVVNKNETGLADINAGFKWAFVACEDQFLTFQMRTYIPTGDAFHGLGTRHVSLEPALLAYQRLSDRLVVEGELRDWIPINGTDFAGNVIRYGVGLGYEVVHSDALRMMPIVEFVGWTVLGGKELTETGVTLDASGDTIINSKIGVRTYFGHGSDLYVGWGHALTGARWYEDILRVEYRYVF